MGCGCAGSTQQSAQQTRRQAAVKAAVAAAPNQGGPGQEGYTWNGPPRRRSQPAPAPAPRR